MNKKIVIALFLALVGILGIIQFVPSIFNQAQADLNDMDGVHQFVQAEITDVSRQEFASWDVYYLDVTNDGVDELIVANPYGQTGHPFMEIIRVEGRQFQRIPAEIPLANHGSVPKTRDGFLAVTSTTSDSGLLHSYLDIYLYDGTKMPPSLLTVTLFRSEPLEDDITGELDGPLTDFTHTLMDIDPLRPNPVVRKGVFQHSFDPETNSFRTEQLEAAEVSLFEVLGHAEADHPYFYDLDGTGGADNFLLAMGDDPRLVINDDHFSLPDIHASSLEQRYRLTPIEYGDRYALVFYATSLDTGTAETYFYEYTRADGLSLMGVIHSEHSLYQAPILALYRDRAVVDYMVYSFAGDTWHVSDDAEWLAENTDLNIGGRFNLQDLTNEPFGDHWVPYDQYVAVIIPMYDGVNLDRLTAKEFVIGNHGGPGLSFAVFGTMHNTVISYVESYFSDDEPILKDVGTIEDAMVTLHAELPWDTSFLSVSGMVYGGEGWENQIQFILDDMRSLEDYEPIFVIY